MKKKSKPNTPRVNVYRTVQDFRAAGVIFSLDDLHTLKVEWPREYWTPQKIGFVKAWESRIIDILQSEEAKRQFEEGRRMDKIARDGWSTD